jgi:hypothetical protein
MELSKGQPASSEDSVTTDRLRLLSCFILPLFLTVLISLLYQPLNRPMSEEYLELALQPSDAPSSLYRPPGYIAFLRFIDAVGGPIGNDRLVPVYIGQGVVLGLATVAWYIVACRWLTAAHAWLMALALGCNPLLVTLVGYIHYEILHIGMCILAGLLLVQAFANDTVSLRRALLAGIACGVLTLTRPMTLVEPAFLALAVGLLVKTSRSSRPWLAWAAFSLAMAATIAPRTWSNYARTGRFIPVNAQIGQQLWPMFEEPIKPTSDNFPWKPLWLSRGIPLLENQVGAAALDHSYALTHPLVLEHVFGSRVQKLVRTQPGVYLSNLAYNALFFWTSDSRLMIKEFVLHQDPSIYVFPAAWAAIFFMISSALLHVCGALGLALGLWRRDPTVTILASLFMCLWMVHSMVYLDFRYIYVKFPFMLWFAGYLIGDYFKTMRSDQKPPAWIFAMFTMSSVLGTALLVL